MKACVHHAGKLLQTRGGYDLFQGNHIEKRSTPCDDMSNLYEEARDTLMVELVDWCNVVQKV